MVQSLLKLTLVGLLVAICGAQSYDFFEDLHARYAAAESINKFSFEFLEEVFKGYNENAAVSTFDPYVLLSIIANGVKGPAKKQLESRLYLNKTAFEKAGIKSLIEKYQAFKKYEFKAAGKIFHSNSFNLKSSFVDETQNIYKSSPASVDFSKTDEAAKAINEWASQSVDSQFQNFISSDKFDQSTQSVLVNALYFKGKFSKKFESFSLTSKPFYFADGSSRDIPTLKTYGSFGAGYLFPGQFAKFIRLPFEYQTGNEALYAYVVVPNNSSNFHYVEKNLHKIDFSAFNAKDEAQFNFYIPKFKYQSTYDLEYVFRYFGIDNIFSYAADFSGMTDNKNKINRFYQKTIVEFDEFHGETANAAVVQDGQNKANDFYVDQPFFVFVVSNDVVVAASRIYDPTKAY